MAPGGRGLGYGAIYKGIRGLCPPAARARVTRSPRACLLRETRGAGRGAAVTNPGYQKSLRVGLLGRRGEGPHAPGKNNCHGIH